MAASEIVASTAVALAAILRCSLVPVPCRQASDLWQGWRAKQGDDGKEAGGFEKQRHFS